jgi:fructokinase
MTKPALMIGLGEVLWDLLPSRKALGGAPANFAYMTNVLGDRGIVASRLGNDDLGREACRVMEDLGLNTSHVQQDDQHETGVATVEIDNAGQPKFTIKKFVSWDYLEWSPAWQELSSQADVICFGSLAQRSTRSAVTIESFLRNAPGKALRIFDANLRQSFYNKYILQKSCEHAHIVKLNEHEVLEVSYLLRIGVGTEEILAKRLLSDYDLRLVCITRGARGSLLVSKDQTIEHQGFRVKVADAVGAGDAFTACLAHHYLRGGSLEEISEAANRFASWVATQTGATPPISTGQIRNIFDKVGPSEDFLRANVITDEALGRREE